MSDENRRNMALFSIGTVIKLTDLTARQIRYYEQHGLIAPARTEGNHRLFSFNDVERLLEIKAMIEKGVNIAGIKQFVPPDSDSSELAKDDKNDIETSSRNEPTDADLHKKLKQELVFNRRPNQVSIIQGELSRFFKQP